MINGLRIGVALFWLVLASAQCVWARDVRVEDAFVRDSSDGQIWTIGTDAVEAVYICEEGQIRQPSLRNKLASPPQEYGSDPAPFGLSASSSTGPFAFEAVWSKGLQGGSTVDLATDAVRLDVKKDDLIGFGAATHSDDQPASVNWPVSVDYGDGTRFASTDDPEMAQGPVWYSYFHSPATGCMDLMEEVLPATPPETDKARVPGGYRAPGECSVLGTAKVRIMNAYEVMRVWKAPKDGTITIQGVAAHAGGNPKVALSIYRIRNRADAPTVPLNDDGQWKLTSAAPLKVNAGGRPAVQLDLVLTKDTLRATLHVQAYPRTSILRQWIELENGGSSSITLGSASPVKVQMPDTGAPYTHYWMCGGTSRPNQGQLESAEIGKAYSRTLLGERTDNYMPWMALCRKDAPGDGWFVALDCLGSWTLGYDNVSGNGSLVASLPALTGHELAPGERLRLPLVTLGMFTQNLDDMARRVYDWQYEYLWDYTNSEYFAQMKWAVPWFFCSRNLQEQFTARLAGLDMEADLMRTMGMEMLWDDAGWSKYPGWPIPDSYSVVFSPSYEGPDYAETLRYLRKMDMTWTLWMAGRPSPGLMDTKVGSWGNFQWRTDGVGRVGLAGEQAYRGQIERFLIANPGCSFHTCDGGSRYAHQFEVQRFADVNYLSDGGRGPQTNHYFSYLELPDKWLDIIDPLMQAGKFKPETAWGQLSMVPNWYGGAVEADREPLRRLMEVYRYLRQEGVAGRWSHMAHPIVKGDEDFQYDQRISYDQRKACVIPKHAPAENTTVYPQGLLPEHEYVVNFESTRESVTRTGADLMTNGILFEKGTAQGAVFLGLPNRPGSGCDTEPPKAPGRGFARRETNLGHSGVGVYWSPASDNNWISYYEVRRDETVIDKASVGTYYFDHGVGWNVAAAYAVRTVDGDGNASDWTPVQPLPGGEDTYAALGGHFPEAGRDGWSAETTTDGQTYAAMTFVPPARNPAGDLGGTPNQPGGVEGYWEGPGGARVGRGWQQASPETASVRTWTAPKAGTVRIVGRAMKECYRQAMGKPLRARILCGDRQVWPEKDWAEIAPNNLVGAVHDIRLDLAAGETIRFVLDRGSEPDADIVAWMPRITYVSSDAVSEGNVLRIRCGAKEPYMDSTGNEWSPDQFHTGGDAVSSDSPIVRALPANADQDLYKTGRQGNDFRYVIPVTPGLYSVRLKFAETQYEWSFERPFNVSIQGRDVLRNFDICQAAHGPRLANDRVFRNVAPDADGNLVLRFTGGFEPMQKTDKAIVQAIEVLPETNKVARIDVGADEPFVDWNGYIWSQDQGFDGGAAIRSESPVAQASPTLYDQSLYQTARTGKSIRCSVAVPPGHYSVHLKFAELWLDKIGQRPMNIEINGRLVRSDWDPASAAGQTGMAADLREEDIAPAKDGTITISVVACGQNDAILQGIEIE